MNHKKFEEIRKDRMGVVKSSVYPGLKNLVSQIYPDEAHFIYELLQNAEDADATEVVFIIKNDKLVFAHNGIRLFNEADINSITNINDSTKKDNYVQAGKFGIGFKSVYAFTETPSIYCDSINFKIEKLLLPTEIEPLEGKKKGWTEFHFPFDSVKISAEEAKRKIKHGLLEIENTTLLFLNNIISIRYILEDGTESCVKKECAGNVVTSILWVSGEPKAKSIWKKYSRTAQLHEKRISVDLAFQMEYENENKLKFVQGQDKVCITFLAKNEKSNLKFYINAPFGCTPSRDTVNKDDNDNKILIGELAELMKTVLRELKRENMLTDDFFEVLPIKDDNVPTFYSPIIDSLYSELKNENYLPTVNGSYVSAENGIMSSKNIMDRAFTIEDIQYLFLNERLQFVKNQPVTSRAYKFLKLLGIKELTPSSVIEQFLTIDDEYLMKWISKINTKQLSEVYAFLYKGIEEIKGNIVRCRYWNNILSSNVYKEANLKLERIKKLRLVRAEDGEFYIPEDVRIVEGEVEVPDEYKIVDKKLLGKPDAVLFLKAIGVEGFAEEELEEYRYKQETRELEEKLNNISEKTDPLKIVRDILEYLSTHETKEVDWSNKKIICSNQFIDEKKKTPIFVEAKECYLDTPYISETGFRFVEDIHNKKGLNDIYLKLKENERFRWIEFLKKRETGCYYKLQVIRKRYSTGFETGYCYDYEVDYLSQYLSKKKEELNKYIWKYFTSDIQWKQEYTRGVWKKNKKHEEQYYDSTLLKTLRDTAWIVDVNGQFCIPAKVSKTTIAEGWQEAADNNAFLRAIQFGAEQLKKDEDNWKSEEALKRVGFLGKKEAESALNVIKIAKELGINLEDIPTYLKRKNKKKNTLWEQEQGLRENKFIANENFNDDEVYPIANPERRASKIKEEMREEKAPEKKIVVAKREEVNYKEKDFVGTEYSGRCQICDKIIYKKDGSKYYVAVNIFDTGRLEEKYLDGLSTGWNTLCLCPNCAAEYKYGAVSMFDFFDKVKKTEISNEYSDFYKFAIEMQGEKRILKYTPRHLLSLKTALEYYGENDIEDNERM